jgi:sugar phosphate isomerase/epimerase
MKLACQEALTPGVDLQEKADNLARWGYDAMEVWGDNIKPRLAEFKKVFSGSFGLSTFCGGYRHHALNASKEERDICLADTKELLSIAADLGCGGLVFVPMWGDTQIPDLSPVADAYKLQKDLLCCFMDEAGAQAAKVGVNIYLEPLNRYEMHFMNRLEEAVAICEKVGNPRVMMMADFFHMNIEEPDIPAAIRAAGKWIGHVHLADSHRTQPGLGHTDFKAGFKALKDIGYKGYMALECYPFLGDANIELKKSADFLKKQM